MNSRNMIWSNSIHLTLISFDLIDYTMYTRQITYAKRDTKGRNKKEEKMIDEFNYLHKESVHFQTVIKLQEIVKDVLLYLRMESTFDRKISLRY